MVIAIGATAQEYKKFKVGIGLGYAAAGGDGAKGGILAYLEPAYRINDAIAIGLRIESALITRGFSDELADDVNLSMAAIGSYTVNGQYYFNMNRFRPFVGAGFGLYTLAAVDVEFGGNSATALEAGTKFGFYPRVGFDYGHLNVSVDYNIISKSEIAGGVGSFKNNYLGIRLGFSIGGGKN